MTSFKTTLNVFLMAMGYLAILAQIQVAVLGQDGGWSTGWASQTANQPTTVSSTSIYISCPSPLVSNVVNGITGCFCPVGQYRLNTRCATCPPSQISFGRNETACNCLPGWRMINDTCLQIPFASYSQMNMKPEQVTIFGEPPVTPSGRTSGAAWVWGRTMYVFGGSGINANGQEVLQNDMWKINEETQSWVTVNRTQADVYPSARARMGYCSINDMFYMFGGFGVSGGWLTTNAPLNEFWAFNATSSTWRRIQLNVIISPRESPIVVCSQTSVFIIGGRDQFTAFSDIWRWDVATNQIMTMASPAGPRHSGAGWFDVTRQLIYFGYGIDQFRMMRDDLWVIQSSGAISPVMFPTDRPTPRANPIFFSSVNKFTNGTLWLAGGQTEPVDSNWDLWAITPTTRTNSMGGVSYVASVVKMSPNYLGNKPDQLAMSTHAGGFFFGGRTSTGIATVFGKVGCYMNIFPFGADPSLPCPCAPGFGVSSSLEQCERCSEGTFSVPFNPVSDYSRCASCPVGWNSTIGASSCRIPVVTCRATGAIIVNGACSCPSGMFGDPNFQCSSCSPGSFSIAGSNIQSCTQCPMNTFAANFGSVSCTACPSNTGTRMPGSASCEPFCPSGTIRVNGTCAACPVSTFRDGVTYYGTLTSVGACFPCPTGFNSTTPGSSSCLANCAIGYERLTASQCSPCQIGRFKSESNNALCIPCPIGTTTRTYGSAVCVPIETAPVIVSATTTTSTMSASSSVGASATTTTSPSVANSSTGSSSIGSSSTGSSSTGSSSTGSSSTGSSSVGSSSTGSASTGSTSTSSTLSTANPTDTVDNIIDTTTNTFMQQFTCGLYAEFIDGRCQCTPGTYGDGKICYGCPRGTFNRNYGGLTQGNCMLCPVNTFSVGFAADCIPCEPGKNSTIGSTQCVEVCSPFGFSSFGSCRCNQGYYGDGKNCQAAQPGFFVSSSGQFEQIRCPLNTFSNTTASRFCFACPFGQTNNTNSTACITNANSCIAPFVFDSSISKCVCPAGRFLMVNRYSDSSCAPCQADTFKSTIGNMNCTSCPQNGTTNGVFGVTSAIFCSCPVGSYRPSAGSACQTCPAGFQTMNSTTCLPCRVGTFRNESMTWCTPCSPNTFAASLNSTSCTPCPTNYVQPFFGQASCMLNATAVAAQCQRGSILSYGGLSCVAAPGFFVNPENTTNPYTPCPIGTYKASVGNTTCTSCPFNATTRLPGRMSVESCICDSGQFGNYMRGCVPCEPGTWSNITMSTEVCNKLPPGTYRGADDSEPKLCTPGTFQDLFGQTACNPCPTGFVSSIAGAPRCVACPRNSYSNLESTRCIPCPSGATTLAPASSDITACGCERGFGGLGSVSGCQRCPFENFGLNSSWTNEEVVCPRPLACSILDEGGRAFNFSFLITCENGRNDINLNQVQWVISGISSLQERVFNSSIQRMNLPSGNFTITVRRESVLTLIPTIRSVEFAVFNATVSPPTFEDLTAFLDSTEDKLESATTQADKILAKERVSALSLWFTAGRNANLTAEQTSFLQTKLARVQNVAANDAMQGIRKNSTLSQEEKKELKKSIFDMALSSAGKKDRTNGNSNSNSNRDNAQQSNGEPNTPASDSVAFVPKDDEDEDETNGSQLSTSSVSATATATATSTLVAPTTTTTSTTPTETVVATVDPETARALMNSTAKAVDMVKEFVRNTEKVDKDDARLAMQLAQQVMENQRIVRASLNNNANSNRSSEAAPTSTSSAADASSTSTTSSASASATPTSASNSETETDVAAQKEMLTNLVDTISAIAEKLVANTTLDEDLIIENDDLTFKVKQFTNATDLVNVTSGDVGVNNLANNTDLERIISQSNSSTVNYYFLAMRQNPYFWANDSSNVSTSAVSFSLLNQDGTEIPVRNVSSCIEIVTTYDSSFTFGTSSSNVTDPTTGKNFTRATTLAPSCVYWDVNALKWSTEGCSVKSVDVDTRQVVCCCTHLTFFSIKSVGTAEDLLPKIQPVNLTLTEKLLEGVLANPLIFGIYVGIAGFYVVGCLVIFIIECCRTSYKKLPIVAPTQYLISIKTRDSTFKLADPHVILVGSAKTSQKEKLLAWYQRGRYSFGKLKEFIVFTEDVGEVKSIILVNGNANVAWRCECVRVLRWASRDHWEFQSGNIPIQGETELLGPVFSKKTIGMSQLMFIEFATVLQDQHKFFSIFLMSDASSVDRASRLTLFVFYVYASLFVNALFFRTFPYDTLLAVLANSFYAWAITSLTAFVLKNFWSRSIEKRRNDRRISSYSNPGGMGMYAAANSMQGGKGNAKLYPGAQQQPMILNTAYMGAGNPYLMGMTGAWDAPASPIEDDNGSDMDKKFKKPKEPIHLPSYFYYIAWILALIGIVAFIFFTWIIIINPTFPDKNRWILASGISLGIELIAVFPLQMVGKIIAVPLFIGLLDVFN